MTQIESEKRPFTPVPRRSESELSGTEYPPRYEEAVVNDDKSGSQPNVVPNTLSERNQQRRTSRRKKIIFTTLLTLLILGSLYRWTSRAASIHLQRHFHSHHEHHGHHHEHKDPFRFGKETPRENPCHKKQGKQQPERLKSHHKHFPNQQQQQKPQRQKQKPTTNDHDNQACNITREYWGQVAGHFDLYDCLDISTASGSVDITLTPHPGHGRAKLRITTVSGSVRVQLSEHYLSSVRSSLSSSDKEDDVHGSFELLNRPLDAVYSTAAGSIQATQLLGSGGTTLVESSAGQVTMDFLAVDMGDDSPMTHLTTSTVAGAQKINVRPLVTFPSHEISTLVAEHKSIGGASIDLSYPAEWEGVVDAQVLGSAGLVVQGNDLDVDVNDGSYVRAHRGESQAMVKITSMGSGSVAFRC